MSTSSTPDVTSSDWNNLAAAQKTSSTTSSSADTNSAAGIQSYFLTLLTTQLQNQDPLNPMDSSQMTSQLAQISTVSGIEKLNSTLQTVLSAYNNSQSMQAAALIGKNVLVSGSSMNLVTTTDSTTNTSTSQSVGGYNLEGDADKVVITIKDANGNTVNSVDVGSMKAGSHLFAWDGTASDGTKAADGTYTISVAATQGSSTVTAKALSVNQVSAVVKGASGMQLELGDGTLVSYDDVYQII